MTPTRAQVANATGWALVIIAGGALGGGIVAVGWAHPHLIAPLTGLVYGVWLATVTAWLWGMQTSRDETMDTADRAFSAAMQSLELSDAALAAVLERTETVEEREGPQRAKPQVTLEEPDAPTVPQPITRPQPGPDTVPTHEAIDDWHKRQAADEAAWRKRWGLTGATAASVVRANNREESA